MENASLKPYPDYKPSGIEWLGDVPAHWDLLPLSAITRPKTDTYKEGLELLSVYLDRGVIKFKDAEERRTNPTSEDVSNYKVVDPGDFVLNNQQAWRGSVGVSKYKGVVSPAYFVLSLSSRLDLEFANLLFRDRSMVSQYLVSSRGVGTIQRNLYWPQLKKITTTVPSLAEQTAIVRYLDRADYRIRRAISVKERLIELLTEQRQAVIHRAVTRGLDPNAPLKDSGVEWLGDVPKHWEVKKLRHILEHVTERNRPDLPLLSVVREQGIILRDVDSKEENHNFIPDDLSNYKVVNSGQFAMNKMKAWQGSFGVSQHSGIVSPAYFVFNIKGVQGTFFHRAIRSKAYVPFFGRASDGVRIGQWDLSQARMREIPFLTPPRPEQSAVVRYLDKATADIDTAIDKAQRQIDLLREYRTRLIADVVTGQVDVRGAVGDEVELPVS